MGVRPWTSSVNSCGGMSIPCFCPVKTRGVAARAESSPSGQNLLDGPAEVHFQSFVAGHLQAARVQSQLVQQGRVNVGDVVAVFDGVEADLVGGAVDDARTFGKRLLMIGNLLSDIGDSYLANLAAW